MGATVLRAIAAILFVGLDALASVRAHPLPGCANPLAIGVSRVVEVDSIGGPRFGAQFSRNSFLTEGEVVLTFDDGPLQPYTQEVLAALSAHCTRATVPARCEIRECTAALTVEAAITSSSGMR